MVANTQIQLFQSHSPLEGIPIYVHLNYDYDYLPKLKHSLEGQLRVQTRIGHLLQQMVHLVVAH